MKSKIVLWTAFTALTIASSWAQETNKTGIVSVTRDFSGKATAVKLIIRSYDIKLDEYSKQLGHMDGERTMLVGVLCDETGKSFVILDPPPQAQAKAGATGMSSAAQQGAVPFKETGKISITKDTMGQIAAIKIIVDSCTIKLDERGKQLESLDGRKVRVTYDALFSEGLLPVTSVELVEAGNSPSAPMAD